MAAVITTGSKRLIAQPGWRLQPLQTVVYGVAVTAISTGQDGLAVDAPVLGRAVGDGREG